MRDNGRNVTEINVRRVIRTAIIPTKARDGDLGYDLFVARECAIEPNSTATIDTGIAIEFPPEYGAILKDRSSIALSGLALLGGVIDSGYRGEIKIIALNFGSKPFLAREGMKIAQLIPQKTIDWRFTPVEKLNGSQRGDRGFGSTDADSARPLKARANVAARSTE